MKKKEFVTPTVDVLKIKGVTLMAGTVTVTGTDNNADLVIGGGGSGGARSEKFFGFSWDFSWDDEEPVNI